jgi:histidinol-phosphate aminotransferase
MNIRKLVRPNIRLLHAYQAEEIPCRVKLDANESPYPLSTVNRSLLTEKKLNRYPDPQAKSLKDLIARLNKVKPDNILPGNGSDELIYNLIITFGGPVLYPVPTFSMYGIISQALGEKRIEIPLDKDFDLDLPIMLRTIRKVKPMLVFLSSPNNPTGNSFSSGRILEIIKASKGLIVIDEAYQPFSARKGYLQFLKKFKNLIVLRTLSKVGLAGLRVGFMISHPDIIREVNKVRLPFNLNSLSQETAIRGLKEKKLMKSFVRSIISERNRLFHEMGKIKGIKPFPSNANFILFRAKNADMLNKRLQEEGVLVRNLSSVIKGCLRVTVGTPKENTIFLKKLKKLL